MKDKGEKSALVSDSEDKSVEQNKQEFILDAENISDGSKNKDRDALIPNANKGSTLINDETELVDVQTARSN